MGRLRGNIAIKMDKIEERISGLEGKVEIVKQWNK